MREMLSRMQAKRRTRIIKYAIKMSIVALVIIGLIIAIATTKTTSYVCYNENSSADYKVYLKENDFFQHTYLEKDNQYIASLIDYVDANFHYDLSIYEKDINYTYSYRIEAEVNVEEKNTGNSLYNMKEVLLEKKTFQGNSNTDVKINEQIKIDYNHYNDIIKEFVSVYELNNAESTLKVNMYINVDGECDRIQRDLTDEYIVTLNIPLTTKTVAIDISSDLIGCEETLMSCQAKKSPAIVIALVIAILIEILFLVRLFKYIVTTRTDETIYKVELKKILSNYGGYIQKINNSFDLTNYQLLWVNTFEDMLKIRDTIQEPILMAESDKKDETYFIIPSKTKILYIFELRMGQIKK